MSRLTRVRESARAPKGAPLTSVVKVMIFLGVALAFALGHIHLRVVLGATEREISALQTEEGQLLSEIKLLRGENETFKNPKTLQAYARHELGMVSYNPSEREVVKMPVEIHSRYALARASSGATRVASAQKEPRWIQSLGERIGMVGEAVARGEAR